MSKAIIKSWSEGKLTEPTQVKVIGKLLKRNCVFNREGKDGTLHHAIQISGFPGFMYFYFKKANGLTNNIITNCDDVNLVELDIILGVKDKAFGTGENSFTTQDIAYVESFKYVDKDSLLDIED